MFDILAGVRFRLDAEVGDWRGWLLAEGTVGTFISGFGCFFGGNAWFIGAFA